MSPRREQLVAACQQLLVVGVVAAVAVPATAIVQLDVVGPADERTGAAPALGVPGERALVAPAPVDVRVTEHALTGRSTAAARTPAGRAERILHEVAEAQHAHEHEGEGDLVLSSATTEPTGPGSEEAVEDVVDDVAEETEQELAVLSEPTEVAGPATVGVTWDPETTFDKGQISIAVRSRSGEAWSDWTALYYDPAHGPDPESPEAAQARPGTGELIVGDVEEVQVAAATEDGAVPEGMSLAVVDPGTTEDEVVEAPEIDTAELDSAKTGAEESSTEGADLELSASSARLPETSVTPKPKIFSRAQWGANESMRDASSLSYFEVHAGFVHHTVNANNYSRRDVPALMRGIYAYHTQSRGWSDIGYNFIVDRFGRIWEGRAGGVDRPVVGAHTLGYNEYSFAMSALGNFEEVQPREKMIDAYARLFAWKLSLHGVSASSTSQYVGSRTFPAINGHRDAGSTACPGRFLYARIPDIRTRAAAYQASFTGRDRSASVSGTTWPDILLRRKGATRMQVLPTEGQLRFAKGRTATDALEGYDIVTPVGDFDGDGLGDMLARDADTRLTRVFTGDGEGGYRPTDRTLKTFKPMSEIADAGDIDGDGRADVVARHRDGRLFLHRGRNGGLRKRVLFTDQATQYRGVQGAGDIDGDGDEDLLARDGDGAAVALLGNGSRGLSTVRRLPGSWSQFDILAAGHDLTGDGRSDVVVRLGSTKKVFVYPVVGDMQLGSPQGPFRTVRGISRLWVVGDGGPTQRLVGREGSRAISFASNGRHNVSDVVTTNVDVSKANALLNVGDWDGDGYGDVIVRERRFLKLWRGSADGQFAGPTTLSKNFAKVRLLAPAGDMTGDGRPDLIGQPKGSAMRIYPGGGSSVGGGYVAHSAIAGNRQVVVGRWNADGAPDSLVSQTDGKVRLYPGNGPGGLKSPRSVRGNVKGMSRLVAVGDLDNDGRPDVVGRQKGSGMLVQLTRTKKGLGLPQYVDGTYTDYDLIG
ncbi:VCBS repeat-containing protein [Nocardioidaceae bacterium]|nr:VCBS repeat-containing protein [Nocardioidaceae bacterium]